MTTFVVIIEFEDRVTREVRGPYRSFRRAEGDAKAWHGIDGQTTSVEPMVSLVKRSPPVNRQFMADIGPCGK